MSQTKDALLTIVRALEKYTDEEHGLSTAELIDIIYQEEGIVIGRKSVYDCIETLQRAGYDIAFTGGRGSKYKMLSKGYDLAELKAIIDSVAAATFLSEKKAYQLIEKIKGLTSVHMATQLTEGLTLQSTIRTDNEKIYYSLDVINSAISQNKQISFRYFDYNLNLKRVARHNGKLYDVSPLRLVVKNDKYYLIATSSNRDGLTTFRVDRMENVEMKSTKRNLKKAEGIDFDAFIRNSFDMYSEEPVKVKIEFDASLLNVAIDRFGRDATLFVKGNGFIIEAEINSKTTFFSWLFNFGDKAKLIAPQSMVDDFRAILKKTIENYGE